MKEALFYAQIMRTSRACLLGTELLEVAVEVAVGMSLVPATCLRENLPYST